jgi:uncharacterized lipoprotein YehR (DUF1307 family)
MNIFELSRKSLIVMLLSMMALVMLSGCSSTEETSDSSGSSSGSACEDLCYSDDVPDMQLDECLMSCGIAD